MRGLGCDVIEIARMEKALENPRFSARVFTEAEQAYIHKKGASSAAAMWAAKEAVAKALGTGFCGFSLQEIEVLHLESGAPIIRLWGGAQARLLQLGGTQVFISLSHSQNSAIAVALIE